MKESSSKRKVTAKLDYGHVNVSPRFNSASRPASPTKQSSQSSLSPPAFRPTAKVSSNATVRRPSSSASLKAFSKANDSPCSTPRPGSPLKQVRNPPTPSIVTNLVKARVTARPASKSAATSPVSSPTPLESRQRSSTTISSRLRPPPQEDRSRNGIAALHHTQSTSALRRNSPPLSQTPSSPELPAVRVNQSVPIKVKSKISGLAKSNGVEIESVPLPSSPWATSRPVHIRPTMPLASSSFSLNASSSPPNSITTSFYPITTAAPAANPHRYASPRRAPSPTRPAHQALTPAEAPSKVTRQVLKAKVDPSSIPLPPHSPPISAISLSSKSSVSKSSLSLDRSPKSYTSASTVNSHAKQRSDIELSRLSLSDDDGSASPTTNGRSSLGRDSDIDSEKSEHKARAAAKSNRKIADLEITNKSLLAINASLETTKNRQAKEIRDLKRKLRESRLILPPRAFRAVESLDLEEEGGDDDDSEEGEEGAGDETYARVKDMLDRLVESGKKALERTSDDFRQSLPTKVLNADEVRTWRDSGQEFDTILDGNGEDEVTLRLPLSPSRVAVPDSDDDLSEDEVERLTLEPHTPPPAHLPPITITPSSESS